MAFELLGKSQSRDIRGKGVSGRGNHKGRGPEVGMSCCVETGIRQGCRKQGGGREEGQQAGGQEAVQGSRRESAQA